MWLHSLCFISASAEAKKSSKNRKYQGWPDMCVELGGTKTSILFVLNPLHRLKTVSHSCFSLLSRKIQTMTSPAPDPDLFLSWDFPLPLSNFCFLRQKIILQDDRDAQPWHLNLPSSLLLHNGDMTKEGGKCFILLSIYFNKECDETVQYFPLSKFILTVSVRNVWILRTY